MTMEQFVGPEVPPYAIVSHTWESEEVSFRDWISGHMKTKPGYGKIRSACDQAIADGLEYV
jgi:hypothetical protein